MESKIETNKIVNSVDASQKWPKVLAIGISIYYIVSTLTLPFVNRFWLGEIPLLAIIQIPKSFLKSVVHQFLMFAVKAFGLSSGSFSPDYGATHGWAMGIMVSLPVLLVIAVFMLVRPLRQYRAFIIMVLLCALIDAVATLWFDNASNLKIYNASFF